MGRSDGLNGQPALYWNPYLHLYLGAIVTPPHPATQRICHSQRSQRIPDVVFSNAPLNGDGIVGRSFRCRGDNPRTRIGLLMEGPIQFLELLERRKSRLRPVAIQRVAKEN
jgi:hypothetical protein